MEKDYNYFHALLIAWYQGVKTGAEIREETQGFLNLKGYKEDFDLFIDALEEHIDEYDDDIAYEWEDYKEYAKDTAPTIKGLCHNLEQVILGKQDMEEFLDWATWHNIDCGETTAGVFENDNIETFCLTFLPENEERLDTKVLQKSMAIIKESDQLSQVEFEKKISALI